MSAYRVRVVYSSQTSVLRTGKMCAARLGVVRNKNIAGTELPEVQFMLIADSIAHASQVNGNVRCICHKVSLGAKDGAREVKPLFDVQRQASLLQSSSHLLCDAHKAVTKDAELDGVDNFIPIVTQLGSRF